MTVTSVENSPPPAHPIPTQRPGTDVRPKPARLHYGDHIRVWGTVAVVVGHVCDNRFFYGVTPLSKDWWILNFWDSATRWAVLAYIMLSGALLLDPAKNETPVVLYKKRLARIGIPLVFWSAFFMLFSYYYLGKVHHWGGRTAKDVWISLFLGEPYAHLHFIFRIAGLYALTPMFRVFLRHSTRAMQIGTVCILLGFSCADCITNNLLITKLSAFARFAPFVGYYLCGFLLRDVVLSKRALAWCWVGLIGTILALAGGTGLLVHHFGPDSAVPPPSPAMMLYDFLSPVRIPMAIFTWLIFVNVLRDPWPRSKTAQRILSYWAGTTLGLYLIHPFFRDVFHMHGFTATWHGVWIGVPVVSASVYLVSLVSTMIIMQIPYVRRIAG